MESAAKTRVPVTTARITSADFRDSVIRNAKEAFALCTLETLGYTAGLYVGQLIGAYAYEGLSSDDLAAAKEAVKREERAARVTLRARLEMAQRVAA